MPPKYFAKICLIKRSEKSQSIMKLEKRPKKSSNKSSERFVGMNHSPPPAHIGLKQNFSIKFT